MRSARSCALGFSFVPFVAACGASPVAPPPCADAPSASASSVAVVEHEAAPVTTKLEVRPLTEASRRLVTEARTTPMTIDAYVSKGFASDAYLKALRGVLDEYATAETTGPGGTMKSRVQVAFHLVDNDAEAVNARNAGLSLHAPPKKSDSRLDLRRGYSGIAVREGKALAVIPYWPTDDISSLEFWLTSKMREVAISAGGQPIEIGVAGGGARSPMKEEWLYPGSTHISIEATFSGQFPYYRIDAIDLGAGPIDPSLRGVVVIGPDRPLKPAELGAIDDFLMLGNRTVVFAVSAVHLGPADPSMRATIEASGVEKLLAGYGVELDAEVALDPDRALQLPVIDAIGQDESLVHPAIPILTPADIDPTFAPFTGLAKLPFPGSAPLVVHKDAQPGATIRVVAKSSARGSSDATLTDMRITEATSWKPAAVSGQHAFAVLVEGAIASPMKKGVHAPAPSRVLVIGSAEFFDNPFARAGNPPEVPPQMAMMGVMGGDETLQAFAGPYASTYDKSIVAVTKNLFDWMAGAPEYSALSARLLESAADEH